VADEGRTARPDHRTRLPWLRGCPHRALNEQRATSQHSEIGAITGRALLLVAGVALLASAAFSIGELSGTRRAVHVNAPLAAPTGLSGLSGLSLSGLQNLKNQVSQAAAVAKGLQDSDGTSADLSQLEQQLGISPTASPENQAEQIQAELNAINACLSGSTATSSAC
jgi:hypothetical protein